MDKPAFPLNLDPQYYECFGHIVKDDWFTPSKDFKDKD